jgi:hypothetical protein
VKVLAALVLLVLTLGASKAARQDQAQSETSPGPTDQPRLQKGWRLYINRVTVWCLGLMTIVSTAVAIWGPIGPTALSIQPSELSSYSPLIVPFLVSNKSAIFWIEDTQFACIIYRLDLNGHTVVTDVPLGSLRPETITPDTIDRHFECAGSLLQFPQGTMTFARLGIVAMYEQSFGFWHRHFRQTYGPFRWDTSLQPAQWVRDNDLQ